MLRLIRSILALLLPTLAWGQNAITSVAGGDWIFPASPLPALNAPLDWIYGIAVAPSGDLLVADAENAIILRVDSSGNATVLAGNGISGYSGDGGPATSASLGHPSGVAADAQGNVYISDDGTSIISSKTCNVRKVSPSGAISTVIHCDDTINATPKLALDPSGNLFLLVSGRVYQVLPSGAVQLIAGIGGGCGLLPCSPVPANTPALSAHFNYLSSAAFDASGNLYLADPMSGVIYKLSTAGAITVLAPIAANQLAIDGSGNLYAADGVSIRQITISTGAAVVLAGNGTATYSGDGGPASSAGFDFLDGLAIDPSGQIYAADAFWVRAFRPDGVIGLVAGNGRSHSGRDGITAAGIPVYYPQGIAADAAGNVYFGEGDYAGRIRRLSGGILSTVAGNSADTISGEGGPALSAGIGRLQAISIDAAGAIYFTESRGGIRRIGADGIIRSLPKPDSATGTGLYPGIAVDRSGSVYVTAPMSMVYRISPSGAVSVYAGTGQSGYNGDNIPATRAQLNLPQGLAADADGNLYIADGYNNRIRKVTPDGIISTVATTHFAAHVAFVAIDGSGNLFAADESHISRLNNGVSVPWFNNTSAFITGIVADNGGNVYLTNAPIPTDTWRTDYSVLEVPANPPVLTVTPAQLFFKGIPNGPATAPQIVNFTGPAGLQFTLNSLPSWLIAASSGTAPASLTLTANPAGLALGAYTAVVPITAPGAAVMPSAVAVTFSVTTPPVSAIIAPNGGLSITLAQNSAPVQQPLLLTNASNTTFTCAGSVSGAAWLSVGSAVTLDTGASRPLMLTVNPAGLAPGVYTGRITVTSTDGSQSLQLPATLTILGDGPSLTLSQTGLTFTAVAGVSPIPSETFWIVNNGGPPVPWTAIVSPASANWLTISAAAGTASASADGASPITVSVTTVGLAPGIYQGQITVSGGGQTASVLVVLNVLPAGSTPPPLVRPAGLLFAAAAGTDSGSQQITISNLTDHALSYSSGRTPDSSPTSGQAWFAAIPSAASIPPGQSQTITVQTNASALNPGVVRGALTLLFDDGTIETVSLLRLTFTSGTAATPASTSGAAAAFPRDIAPGCTPSTLYGAFTTLPNGSTITPGQPTTVGAVLVDDCGAPLETGGVQVLFSDSERPLSLNATDAGYWEASWIPPATASALTLQLASGSGASIAQLNI
jgi:sugar lactone lactonase YvrE